jgi:hypothetical protein
LIQKVREKFSSKDFIKGVKRGLVAGELILRQLLREIDESIIPRKEQSSLEAVSKIHRKPRNE